MIKFRESVSDLDTEGKGCSVSAEASAYKCHTSALLSREACLGAQLLGCTEA